MAKSDGGKDALVQVVRNTTDSCPSLTRCKWAAPSASRTIQCLPVEAEDLPVSWFDGQGGAEAQVRQGEAADCFVAEREGVGHGSRPAQGLQTFETAAFQAGASPGPGLHEIRFLQRGACLLLSPLEAPRVVALDAGFTRGDQVLLGRLVG